MPCEKIANSLEEFLQRVSEIESAVKNLHSKRKEPNWCDLWFRGSEDADYPLIPSLYRGFVDTKAALEEEDELRFQFQRQGRQMLGPEQQPKNHWEWYFLMRHYGAPTRLLDWTDGALIAMYFAITDLKGCKDADKEKKDKAVWVLDPSWLNESVVNNDSVLLWDWPVVAPYLPSPLFDSDLSAEYPVALDPPHVARRVAVQRSRFTIHGTKREGLEAIDSEAGSQSRLFKIIIANKEVPRIKKDLERCGITRTTLFPDLDSLGAELADDLATKAVRRVTKSK